MGSDSIPDIIMSRFRTLSLERVARVDNTWTAVIQGAVDDAALREMSRDLHTLKGDARVVGFEEVHLLAHKLEELIELAAELEYQVSEDFELVVTMALQFLGMLLKKKPSAAMSGINLAGFMRQVEEVVHETRTQPAAAPRHAAGSKPRAVGDPTADRLSDATRERLAIAATTAFLEYLGARGAVSRNRLRTVWKTLREELGRIHAVELAPVLERHADAARELAAQLGKQVDVVVEAGEGRTDSRVVEAIDIAMLHLVRNALDHGIEAPDVRTAAGKPPRGTLRIRFREIDGRSEITVSDDGGGIDVAEVRAKAVERNVITAPRAESASEREMLELLFHPGFSTRSEITDLSGRGVGLDAAKTGLLRVGGAISIATRRGSGSTVTLGIPSTLHRIGAYQFLAPGGAVSLAVSARWTPSLEANAREALDPLGAIQLVGTSRQTALGSAENLPELGLRFRWGFLEVALRAASEPVLVLAERFCPTPDEHPIEVVQVAGHETLLLRPEHVTDLMSRGAAMRVH